MHNYAILQPSQTFSCTAMLSPFPKAIAEMLEQDAKYRTRSQIKSQVWPMKIFIDDTLLAYEHIDRFLTFEKEENGRVWDIQAGKHGITPMLDRPRRRGDPAVAERNGPRTDFLPSHCRHKSWIIWFSTEKAAILFWRTWHRRPFPVSGGEQFEDPPRLLHIDHL